jgi:hypothetical protein
MGVLSQILFNEITGREKLRGQYATDAANMVKEIKELFGDKYPAFLEPMRPREGEKELERRKGNFVNMLKSVPDKVVGRLSSIFSAEDYAIDSKNEDVRSWFNDDFEDYYQEQFLKSAILDPNSIEVRVYENIESDIAMAWVDRYIIPNDKVYYFSDDYLICELPTLSDVLMVIGGSVSHIDPKYGKMIFVCSKTEWSVASIAQIHKKTKEASDQNADVYWQIRGINELVFANKDDDWP